MHGLNMYDYSILLGYHNYINYSKIKKIYGLFK